MKPNYSLTAIVRPFILAAAFMLTAPFNKGTAAIPLSLANQSAPQLQEEKTIFNCQLNTDAEIYAELDNMESFFPKQFGMQATDSIHAIAEHARQLQAKGQLVFRPTSIKYTPTNTPFTTWLTQLFTGAKTTADSIELLTQWIPANFAYGENDQRIQELNTDSLYTLIQLGLLTGNYESYATFLCRLVQQHGQNWGWGVALKLSGMADKAITGGPQNPKHTWVGFAKANAEIWCLADPAIGGGSSPHFNPTTSLPRLYAAMAAHPVKGR